MSPISRANLSPFSAIKKSLFSANIYLGAPSSFKILLTTIISVRVPPKDGFSVAVTTALKSKILGTVVTAYFPLVLNRPPSSTALAMYVPDNNGSTAKVWLPAIASPMSCPSSHVAFAVNRL